ncbi:MAG: DUF1152 domain-containing protein [Acidilobaceae archaeon]
MSYSLSFDSLEDLSDKRVLVVGVGGGGDTLGALLIYYKLKRMGSSVILGNIVWERMILDPFPGPIQLEQVFNAEYLGGSCALVNPESYVDRFGYKIKPQIIIASEILGEKTIFLDLNRGDIGLIESFDILASRFELDAIIGVDVGGDILAIGCEEDIWSPLADSLSLNALAKSKIPTMIAVIAPGADGELSQQLVIKRISEIALREGLIGVYGVNRREYKILKSIANRFVSEASKIPLEAFSGYIGQVKIRGGSRTVDVNPISTTIFLLDTRIVYSRSLIAQTVANSKSIREARDKLNSKCIYTELDLEEDLYNYRLKGSDRPVSLIDIRSEGRRKLLLSGCTPLKCL